MSKSRARGTAAETAVVRYLRERWIPADRLPLRGSGDIGDVWIAGVPVVIEVKNCRTSVLSEWVDQMLAACIRAKTTSGVVWHHRKGKGNPSDWYCTMTGAQFVDLMLKAYPPKADV